MLWPVAHGVGSRGDLPLPLWQFAWAAMAAIVISFLALGILWNSPRFTALSRGRSVSSTALAVAAGLTRLLGVGLYVLVLASALFGTDDSDVNLAPVTIYVVAWVGIATVSGAVADAWTAVNPFAVFARAIDRMRGTARVASPLEDETADSAEGHSNLDNGWYWWAPLGLLSFLVLELVHPSGDSPRLMGIAMLIHLGVTLAGAWRNGAQWIRHGEPFTFIFRSIGAMAPIGSNEAGAITVRAPLAALSNVRIGLPGLAALLVVLGGTSFDGFAESTLGRDLFDAEGRWASAAVLLLGLLGSIVVVAALFLIATRFAARATGASWRRTLLDFAPSLVPIVFGYTVAHYAQLLVDETQTFVFLLSDPFGLGWNLFGGADNRINFTLISVDLVAWIQAGAIVVGHIAAVVVAHDRAIERFTHRQASRSQYAMLFVMVLYSLGGLWLLLNA